MKLIFSHFFIPLAGKQTQRLVKSFIDIALKEMASVGFREPERHVKSSINFATPAASMDSFEDDLEIRIEEYKFDNAADVEELRKCIHEVLNEAERIAQERLDKKAVSMKIYVN